MRLLSCALATFLLVCLVPSCGGRAVSEYVGEWELDVAQNAASNPAGGLTLDIHDGGRFEMGVVNVAGGSAGTWEETEQGILFAGGMEGLGRIDGGKLLISGQGDAAGEKPKMVFRPRD